MADDSATAAAAATGGRTGKLSNWFRRDARGGAAVPVESPPVLPPPQPQRTGDAAVPGGAATATSYGSQRIFYSSHHDDDSDDSYERRAGGGSGRRGRQRRPASGDGGGAATTFYSETGGRSKPSLPPPAEVRPVLRRYRGFSTSLRSLFLDEPLVCAAAGCFGLLLSGRTEHLLRLRGERRRGGDGTATGADGTDPRLPSRVVAHGLLVTVALMFSTFVVFGFGTGGIAGGGGGSSGYGQTYGNGDDASAAAGDDAGKNDDGGNNNDNNNNNNRNLITTRRLDLPRPRPAHGVFKLRDAQRTLWNPAARVLRNEWYHGVAPEDGADERWHRRQQEFDTAQPPRDLGSDIRLALMLTFLLFLGVLGRRRRVRTRFHLARARAEEDRLFYAAAGAAGRSGPEDARETPFEGGCAHTLCGCYPVDHPDAAVADDDDFEVEVSDDDAAPRKTRRFHEDIVARGFNGLMASCCGALCRCWCQCLSVCALAQEAREMRLLLPPRLQRIDFITHQPFREYQKDVNNLRRGWMGRSERLRGVLPHWYAISRLSRYILLTFSVSVAVIVATLLFNPRAAFSWQDAVVLTATFLQSFLVLFVVHWIFHKSDLSLDAVIKLFAAGFVIAVPTAFVLEAVVVNSALLVVWGLYEVFAVTLGEMFTNWFLDHWRLMWILGELFNAYIVAAVTEELCKYYTFRAVEHPDLVFLTGLHVDEPIEKVVDGSLVNYPFSSHQVQVMNKEMSDEMSLASHRNRNQSRRNPSQKAKALLDGPDSEEVGEEPDMRSHRQKAMAITTGMISVAVGLACAENFLYVFVFGGALGSDNGDGEHDGDILQAWVVLLFRSIFPIHALAAAMQSVNMIRKFVETTEDDGHRIGVGRIILPAVLLHGSFDAMLMGINVFIETSWDNYLDENDGNVSDDPPYNSLVVNCVAWLSITAIMLVGLIWYICQNRSQRQRLILLEEAEKAKYMEWHGQKKKQPEQLELV